MGAQPKAISFGSYLPCFLDFFDLFGLLGCAPGLGISAVGLTLRSRSTASFSGSGMRISFPGLGMALLSLRLLEKINRELLTVALPLHFSRHAPNAGPVLPLTRTGVGQFPISLPSPLILP
jgi:hypothetical protein